MNFIMVDQPREFEWVFKGLREPIEYRKAGLEFILHYRHWVLGYDGGIPLSDCQLVGGASSVQTGAAV
jgi:hypothetical protein